ncbi:MAG: hypothetical protein ABI679_08325 [Gemmatimonadota bacterium]
MRRFKACLIAGMIPMLTIAIPLPGQSRQAVVPSRGSDPAIQRSGFWFGAGVGSARADVSCNICISDPKSELSGNLRAGITLTRSVLLGLEGTGVANSEDGVNERYVALSVVVYTYPTRSGMFVKGGLGLIDYRADDDIDRLTSRPLVAQVGVGYEFRLSRSLSLQPFGNLMATSKGNLSFNGTRVTDDVSFTLLQFGIGLALH